MRREISVSELREHHLFMASPQYGGQCATIFCKGMVDLAIVTGSYQIPFDHCYYTNESLVTRARNYCVDTFLSSEAKHLLFVDADIGFAAQDALELLILQIQHSEYEIIGAPYKTKAINGHYAANWDGDPDFTSQEPIEVTGIGTGFMLIRREVFAKLGAAFPQFKYVTDSVEPPFNGKEIMQYFQAEIDPGSKRYLSEDYWFSRRCKEIGIRTWLCPWMKLRHAGTHIFE